MIDTEICWHIHGLMDFSGIWATFLKGNSGHFQLFQYVGTLYFASAQVAKNLD